MTKRKSLEAPVNLRTPTLDMPLPADMEWQEREQWHMAHAATPLNGRSMRVNEHTLYVHEALDYVNDILHDSIQDRPHVSPSMFGHLEIAVQSSLFSRIEENEQKSIPPDCDERSAELFMRACEGIAEPDELLSLLRKYPTSLGSLELAKQTYIGDWQAAEKMDGAIAAALSRHDAYLRTSERTQNVRYAITRIDDTRNPRTVTLVRKADQGVVIADDGVPLSVVQRDSYVVDLTHLDTNCAGSELHDWLRTPQAREKFQGNVKISYDGAELVRFMDGQLATDSARRSPALIPAVRSYYAFAPKRSVSL